MKAINTHEDIRRLLRIERAAERRRLLAALGGSQHEVDHVAGLHSDCLDGLLLSDISSILSISTHHRPLCCR